MDGFFFFYMFLKIKLVFDIENEQKPGLSVAELTVPVDTCMMNNGACSPLYRRRRSCFPARLHSGGSISFGCAELDE